MPTPIECNALVLRRYFLRRKLPPWDADDMVQDVFLKLLAMGRSPDSEEKSYIYTVARTLLIDKYRSDKRKKTSSHVSYQEDQSAAECSLSPDVQLHENRLHAVLVKKFNSLTLIQQKTFSDYRFKGKRLREIAEDRQVTQSAIEKALKTVSTRLRAELMDYCRTGS